MPSLLILFLLVVLLVIQIEMKFTKIDKTKYQAGKDEYELIQRKSELPDYGYCWKNTVMLLNTDCKQVTAEIQGKLALAYLNCFLIMQGLMPYKCEESNSLSQCTSGMKDADRSSLATFFTHTQNICYFLEAQVWHDQTENTINRLSTSADDVAARLEESSDLQSEMIKQQKESIENQVEILDKAANLSKMISSSSETIHSMFDEFRNITKDQWNLINDLVNKITHLQSVVIGEFTGFYSVVYYALMLLVSYLLTSTYRTATARFWLFGIATVNFLSERFVISLVTSYGCKELFGFGSDENVIYACHWLCRKFSGIIALVVLMFFAYSYQDYNIINNHLLLDIRKQISDLKNVMPGQNTERKEILLENSPDSMENMIDNKPTGVMVDSTGWDSSDSGCSESTSAGGMSDDTDHTYVPSMVESTDSYSTCISYESRLTDELRDIREATPLKELAQQIDNWSKTGRYMEHSPLHSMEARPADHRFPTSKFDTPQFTSSELNREYHLRPRSGTPVWKKCNCCSDESPKHFAKTVKSMEKLSRKHGSLTKCTAKRRLNVVQSNDG